MGVFSPVMLCRPSPNKKSFNVTTLPLVTAEIKSDTKEETLPFKESDKSWTSDLSKLVRKSLTDFGQSCSVFLIDSIVKGQSIS